MGSATSKTARAAPTRKYPTRAAGASPAQAQARTRPPGAPIASNVPPKAQPPRPPRPRKPEPAAVEEPQRELEQTEATEAAADVKDNDFADRLRQMGIVQPNPTFSPSSTAGPVQSPAPGARPTGGAEVRGHDADILRQIENHRRQYASAGPSSSAASPAARPNTTLTVLEARRRIQDQAAADHESFAQKGREFLSALTLRDALVLRSRGVEPAAIEKRLRLKPGVIARLGHPGLVEALNVAQAVEESIPRNTKK
ncbi:hypothetical protein SCUCBS95973_004275 [Sporothrix curviconia]|uniref:Helix-turn-helix domain-containing protein n=1 Tax=Sporothrix curviconia TaxID=1260050 RepID=A0ABP0BMV3_9PEZI